MQNRFAPIFAACLVAISLSASNQVDPSPPYDVLIRGGRVLDGTGNPWRYADIAVQKGRIVAIGSLGKARATRVIDASGLYVSPGFIDVHSHAGGGLADDLNHARPLLAQGLTTVAVNPDGGGPVDIAAQRANYEKRGVGVNVAIFIGHGSVRQQVLGMSDRDPNKEDVLRMAFLVRTAMRAGAVGLSSGLYYAPGSYAKTEEVIELARVAAESGGVYSSHIRDEADYSVGVVAAVEEVIRIAEEARLPGIVSHMKALGPRSWGLAHVLTRRIDAARERGVEVYVDQYPYEASGTGIGGALIPRWAQVGGRAELLKRMRGPERARLLADIRANLQRRDGPEKLMISRYAADPSLEGLRLSEVAQTAGQSPEETALALLERGDAGLVSFNMSDDDLVHIMRQPYTMTCTDGDLVPMGQGKPHPRAYGAFARKLAVYVRERGVLDWASAIRSMTSLPASVFGMRDRGQLRPGAWADILVFDPQKVREVGTYLDPHHLAEGMVYELVNGQLVRDKGEFTGALAGKVVTPER